MNLTLHIIKKDIRALRVFWCLWIAVIAAQVAVAAALLDPVSVDLRRYLYLDNYFYAVGAAWMLFGYLLAAAVILQDPPSGARVFWLTRPISGIRLLGAKLVTIIVFLVIAPAVVWLPWRIHCGFGISDLWGASFPTIVLAAMSVGPAVILATISGTGPRFMLYSIVGFVMAATGALIVLARLTRDNAAIPVTNSGILFILCVSAAVLNQFLTRRWWCSVALVIAAFGLAIGAAYVWPYAGSYGLTAIFEKPPVTAAFASQVKVSEKLAYMIPQAHSDRVTIGFRLEGVPDAMALAPGMADIDLVWTDGTHVSRERVRLERSGDATRVPAVAAALGVPVFTRDPETDAHYLPLRNAARKKAGQAPLSAMPGYVRDCSYWANMDLAPDIAERLQKEPPVCVVKVTARFSRPRVLYELPAGEAGGRGAGGMYARVLGASMTTDRKTGMGTLGLWIADSRVYRADLDGYVVNRGVPGGVTPFYSVMDFIQPTQVFVDMHRYHLALPVGRLWRSGRWVNEPDWRSRLSLAIVRFEAAGQLERTVRVDRLVLGGQP